MAVLDQVIKDRYAIWNGDCVEVLKSLPDESIHLSLYSPPFGTSNGALYTYSSSDRDLSNSRDYDNFFEHYSFVIKELYRVTHPGRISAVHCTDCPTGNTGVDNLIDFPGDIIRAHVGCTKSKCKAPKLMREAGMCGHGLWTMCGRYHIWKEPLTVRNRTMQKNLAHKTIVEDSSRCSVASADQMLVFRRKGENKIPIEHPIGLTYYAGSRQIPANLHKFKGWTGNQIQNQYSHWIWRQYASAFWDDVRLDRVLPFREARDEEDERHCHPLQLDAIERIVTLWSNHGETVFTPFMGVGSECYGAVTLGRKGMGAELKTGYFKQAIKNMALAKEGNPEDQGQFEYASTEPEPQTM